jgi:hypothetical protein
MPHSTETGMLVESERNAEIQVPCDACSNHANLDLQPNPDPTFSEHAEAEVVGHRQCKY